MYDHYQKKLNIDYKIYLENHIKKYWSNYIFMEDIQEALKTAYNKFSSIEARKKDAFIILDTYLGNFDLTESFTKKIILLNTEPYKLEHLLILHDWLIDKCCNITNIFLISDHSMGAKKWYEDYLNLFNVVGFNIIETPIRNIHRLETINFLSDYPLQKDAIRKKIKYYFSAFMGGYSSSMEKDVLATFFLSKKNIGYIEYLSGYCSSEYQFENYLESITYFSNREQVEILLKLRKDGSFSKYNQNNNIPSFHDQMKSNAYDSLAQIYDQSFCQLLRETYNSEPWTCITEKTLDCFLNYMVPIPLSINSVSNLENIGFKFDHTMIDYSFQHEKDFFKRIVKIGETLETISKTYSLADLEEYILNNREILCYNYNYIVSNDLKNHLEQEFINQL